MPPRKTGAAGSKKGTKAKSAADQPADEIAVSHLHAYFERSLLTVKF